MREKLAFLVISSLLLCGPVLAQEPAAMCGVPDVDPETARWIERLVEGYRARGKADVQPVRIPVAFHVVTAGQQGQVSRKQIGTMMRHLNWAFRGSPYSFYLERIDRTDRPAWHNNCGPETPTERAMKRRLARDPKRVLNMYVCKPYIPQTRNYVLGYSTFPSQYEEGSFLHGVQIHPDAIPGGAEPWYNTYGLGAHEVGHYLGLYHTFQGACGSPTGDHVDDTPAQAAPQFDCPENVDTCPFQEGFDDVRNFMNYSDDRCMEHFTPGQIERTIGMTGTFRPTLVPW